MIIKIMTTQVLQVILSAITSSRQLGAARQPFESFAAVEGWLTGFAMAALMISLVLVFFQSVIHRRSSDTFRRRIEGLTALIEELKQQNAEPDKQAPAHAPEQNLTEESEELVTIPEN